MKKSFFIIMLCALYLGSCGTDSPFEDLIKGGSEDVYIAGYVIPDMDMNMFAVYWKNGEIIPLTDGTQDAEAVHISVTGNDVHVYGVERISLGEGYSTSLFRHWKNGKVVSDNDFDMSHIRDMAISGSDIYIVGTEYRNVTINKASYWKNGKEVVLTSDNNKKERAEAIFVSGNDVYVAGIEFIYGSWGIPKYWKNGEEIYISDYKVATIIKSIFVSGNDVYIAGYEYADIAKYWKNGKGVNLSTEDSRANYIVVSGNDVYVAGQKWDKTLNASVATYWKNDREVRLSESSSRLYTLLVSGNDVYAVGESGYTPKYWKNGTEILLGKGAYYDSEFYSIAVKK